MEKAQLDVAPKLVGEILALRSAFQVLAGIVSYKVGLGNDGMAQMHVIEGLSRSLR